MAYHLGTNFHPTMLLLNLQLTDLQRHDPERLTAISTLPAGVFRRTRALLLPDQGHTLASIARLFHRPPLERLLAKRRHLARSVGKEGPGDAL